MKHFILFLSLLLSINSDAKAPVLTAEELATPPPKIIRTCCSFGADLGIAGIPFKKQTDITALNEIGRHQYLGDKKEGNGIIYSARGGFIDLGHVRDCADWTAYLFSRIEASDETEISIDLGNEGGSKSLNINIPEIFNVSDAQQLAAAIAYDLSLWHEIATWFGASFIPFIPEGYSSFSPEDLYSNLLGVTLGIKALNSDLEYEEAMTQLLEETLIELESVCSQEETFAAMQEVENIWWTKQKRLPSKKILLKRYFDTDNILTPWLIPETNKEINPFILEKPNPVFTSLYEIKVKLNRKFPLRSIYESKDDRIITNKDFDDLMSFIIHDVNILERKIAYRSYRQKWKQERKILKKKQKTISI